MRHMANDHLLLPGAKTGIMVTPPHSSHWLRKVVIALGVLAVLVGGADALSRFSQNMFGCNAGALSFAPAITLIDPSAVSKTGAEAPCK